MFFIRETQLNWKNIEHTGENSREMKMTQKNDEHEWRRTNQDKGKHRDLCTKGREGPSDTGGAHGDWCRQSKGRETGPRQEVKMENTQGAETTKIKQETEHREKTLIWKWNPERNTEWEIVKHRNRSNTNINTGIDMKHKEVIINLKTLFRKRWE